MNASFTKTNFGANNMFLTLEEAEGAGMFFLFVCSHFLLCCSQFFFKLIHIVNDHYEIEFDYPEAHGRAWWVQVARDVESDDGSFLYNKVKLLTTTVFDLVDIKKHRAHIVLSGR